MKKEFSLKDKTLENFEKYITLFYSKVSGNIKIQAGGIQDMDYFGEDKDDYNYDFIVVERDDFLLNNLNNFRIVDGEISLKEDSFISKYLK